LTPSAWQGWLVVLIYVAGMVKIIHELLPASSVSSPTRLFVGVVIWTALFFIIVYRTGESSRWQWGDRLENKEVDDRSK